MVNQIKTILRNLVAFFEVIWKSIMMLLDSHFSAGFWTRGANKVHPSLPKFFFTRNLKSEKFTTTSEVFSNPLEKIALAGDARLAHSITLIDWSQVAVTQFIWALHVAGCYSPHHSLSHNASSSVYHVILPQFLKGFSTEF